MDKPDSPAKPAQIQMHSEPPLVPREPGSHTLDPALAARIRNEVKVTKTLTNTHRRILFTVGKRHPPGTELVAYVRALCPRYEPEYIQRWCARGQLRVNDVPVAATHQPLTGERVELHAELPPPDPTYTPPPLSILWHDEYLALLAKEPGHLAHQAGRIMTGTLINQLQDWMIARGGDPGNVRLVNRIDRDTSGLVLASLELTAHIGIADAVARREVTKEYQAICVGVPTPEHGHWREPIGDNPRSTVLRQVREDGLPCHTEYHVTDSTPDGRYSLLHIHLHTGRQHQIRVHAAHHGYPLVGDWMYGSICADLPGQALHAAAIAFTHPITKHPMRVEAPLPATFRRLWEHLRAGGELTPSELNEGQRQRLGQDGGERQEKCRMQSDE